ncbi:transporter substrate-binding domain-containing protein [Shewanella aestuarii]|uniref:Transporter substrate-binding domain-containing protein n=1 Tax=Shewanella aestuarii TaxID=1028752 RepID=A0A6G9QJB1_9GAMM|nr:transporter substrate-binding domain-containing protein [Shewanella aestuarii]QIR14478.1 transporter substrate-binding domain-containing protein [Shewanella aestuarii]
MKIFAGMLFFLVCIGFGQRALAEDTSTLPLKANNAPLILVMGEDTFPFQFIDQNNKPAGILVELWQEWSLVTQTPIEIRPYNWGESLQRLQDGTGDIHIGMTTNALRQQKFDFASPITSLQTYLFIHKSIKKKLQLLDLLPYQIGIVAGSSHEQTLLDINPHFTFRKYPSREALLDGAANGEVLVFAGIEGYQRNLALEQDIANEYYSSSRLPITKVGLSPAVIKGNDELVNQINAGFKQIDVEQIRKIERRWLGYNRQNSGVMIAMQTNVEPFVDIGIDGRPHGLFVDLWNLWSEKTGISIDFIIGDMNTSIGDIKRGFADVHIGYPESNEMRTGLQQAWHLTSVKSRFFSLQNDIENIEHQDNIRIGVFPTAPYLSEIHKLFPKAQLRFYETTSAMANATIKGI